MTNHVHLIISPGEQTDHVSKLMRIVAARQTRYVNKLEKRTGTLWEGRFKASLIETDAYVLACCRYVELNPVRAAMVTSPQDYPWSSYRVRGTIGDVDLLDPCYVYEALGKTEAERFLAYESLVAEGISDDELNMIRTAVQRNQLTGTQHFRDDIARRSGRRVSARGQGRPRKRV
jgi:putative transposase